MEGDFICWCTQSNRCSLRERKTMSTYIFIKRPLLTQTLAVNPSHFFSGQSSFRISWGFASLLAVIQILTSMDELNASKVKFFRKIFHKSEMWSYKMTHCETADGDLSYSQKSVYLDTEYFSGPMWNMGKGRSLRSTFTTFLIRNVDRKKLNASDKKRTIICASSF